jgi:hypothetical protein
MKMQIGPYDKIQDASCFSFESSGFAEFVKVIHNWFSGETKRLNKFSFLRFSKLEVGERLKAC